MFTRDSKEPLPPNDKPVIVLTTYSMICTQRRYNTQMEICIVIMKAHVSVVFVVIYFFLYRSRAADSELLIGQIEKREWALMVLDEVHVTPAYQFRKVLSKVHAHCKLGMTAPLVRADGLIDELNF